MATKCKRLTLYIIGMRVAYPVTIEVPSSTADCTRLGSFNYSSCKSAQAKRHKHAGGNFIRDKKRFTQYYEIALTRLGRQR